jgi:hypothetical protein
MSAVVVLEWKFSPPDYFTIPIEISHQDYRLTITSGKAELKINSASYDADPSTREALHYELESRFLGIQLLTHRGYELSCSTMTRVPTDGLRDSFMEVTPYHSQTTAHLVDMTVRDKHVNIIDDSLGNRIEKEKKLADLVSTYRATDQVLESLLLSYDAAVRDSNNELVHLYGIRDTLTDKFGNDTATRSALGISSSDWSRFRQLCKTEPLRQARHRGKSDVPLRDSTQEELLEVRGIASDMIKGYLRYLDDHQWGIIIVNQSMQRIVPQWFFTH